MGRIEVVAHDPSVADCRPTSPRRAQEGKRQVLAVSVIGAGPS